MKLKRMLSLLLSLAMCLSLIAVPAYAKTENGVTLTAVAEMTSINDVTAIKEITIKATGLLVDTSYTVFVLYDGKDTGTYDRSWSKSALETGVKIDADALGKNMTAENVVSGKWTVALGMPGGGTPKTATVYLRPATPEFDKTEYEVAAGAETVELKLKTAPVASSVDGYILYAKDKDQEVTSYNDKIVVDPTDDPTKLTVMLPSRAKAEDKYTVKAYKDVGDDDLKQLLSDEAAFSLRTFDSASYLVDSYVETVDAAKAAIENKTKLADDFTPTAANNGEYILMVAVNASNEVVEVKSCKQINEPYIITEVTVTEDNATAAIDKVAAGTLPTESGVSVSVAGQNNHYTLTLNMGSTSTKAEFAPRLSVDLSGFAEKQQANNVVVDKETKKSAEFDVVDTLMPKPVVSISSDKETPIVGDSVKLTANVTFGSGVENTGKLSYAWYKAAALTGSEQSVGSEETYTVPSTQAGTLNYYTVVVTNTDNTDTEKESSTGMASTSVVFHSLAVTVTSPTTGAKLAAGQTRKLTAKVTLDTKDGTDVTSTYGVLWGANSDAPVSIIDGNVKAADTVNSKAEVTLNASVQGHPSYSATTTLLVVPAYNADAAGKAILQKLPNSGNETPKFTENGDNIAITLPAGTDPTDGKVKTAIQDALNELYGVETNEIEDVTPSGTYKVTLSGYVNPTKEITITVASDVTPTLSRVKTDDVATTLKNSDALKDKGNIAFEAGENNSYTLTVPSNANVGNNDLATALKNALQSALGENSGLTVAVEYKDDAFTATVKNSTGGEETYTINVKQSVPAKLTRADLVEACDVNEKYVAEGQTEKSFTVTLPEGSSLNTRSALENALKAWATDAKNTAQNYASVKSVTGSNGTYTVKLANKLDDTVDYTVTVVEKYYTVKLNLDGGSFATEPTGWTKNNTEYTREVPRNTLSMALPTPTKQHQSKDYTYEFAGWKIAGSDTLYSRLTLAMLDKADNDYVLTLTASYTEKGVYNIFYENVNKDEIPENAKTQYSSDDAAYTVFTPADRTEEGLTIAEFLGWTDGESVTTPTKSYRIANGSSGNKYLTANWKSLKHTLTSTVLVDGKEADDKATFNTANRSNVNWVATAERTFRVTPPTIKDKILTGVTATAMITEIKKDSAPKLMSVPALTVALDVKQDGKDYVVTLPTLNSSSDVEYSINVTLGYVKLDEVQASDTAPTATGTNEAENAFLERFTDEEDQSVVNSVEATTGSAQEQMKIVLDDNDATLYTEEQATKAGSDLKDSVVAALQSKIDDDSLGLVQPEGMTDRDFNNLKAEAKKARAEQLYNVLLEANAIAVQEVSTLEMNVKQISYDKDDLASFNMTVGLDLAMQGQVGVDAKKLEGVGGLSNEMKEALAEVQSQNIGDSLNMSKLLKDTETTTAQINVEIPVPTDLNGKNTEDKTLWVVHIIDDKGNWELLEASVVDGVLKFTTSSFSDFVIYLSDPFKATLKHEGSEAKPYLSLTDALKNAQANDTIEVKALTDAEKTDGVKPTSAISNVTITAADPADTLTIVPKDTFKSNSVGSTTYTPSTQDVKNGDDEPTGAYTLTVTRSTKTSGGGGGGGAVANVIVAKADNGNVKVSNTAASAGDKVTVTMTPNSGYEADTLTLKDKNGNEITATKNSDGTYTFTMPVATLFPVTVTGTFKAVSKTGFVDVDDDEYYAAAVEWAVKHDPQITNGTDATHFSPEMSCTRAQVVTFLWRAAGAPEPTTTTSVFTDSADTSEYYYKAVLWAVENGITKGTSSTTFSPDDIVTRGQVVTFLYRYEKAASVAGSTFIDVAADAYYAPSVNWAYENGITTGTSSKMFSPDNDCTRAQIVTFLYRDMVK